MKYIQRFKTEAEMKAFKKHVMAEGDPERHSYTVIYGETNKEQCEIFAAPAEPDRIIYEISSEAGDSDTLNIINGLIEGKLLGKDFDYQNDRIILESDLKNITELGSVFSGSIKNKVLEQSKYSIRNFTSFENFTNVTNIDGMSNGDYKNFFGMLDLERINIPKSVKEIGNSAFAFCLNLSDIKMHNEISAIRIKAFYNCMSLTSIEIPESVTVIENNSFNKCDNLKKIIIKSDKPCKIYKDTFTGISDKCVIYVPKSSLNTYKEQWKNYASMIKGI